MLGKFAAVARSLLRWTMILRMLEGGHALRASAAPTFQFHERMMPNYYFDMKDGVPVRDRVGLEFPTDLHAIEHAKKIAHRFGHEHPGKHRNLCITVLSEAGTEIHREPVYLDIG